MTKFIIGRVENIVGYWTKCYLPAFPRFHRMFSEASSLGLLNDCGNMLKHGIVGKKLTFSL